MPNRIEHIVVVGGGTAGWMSACYLQRVLSGARRRAVTITVVESDDVGIIGVGEATIPSIRSVLNLIGVPEWRLLADADATFKNAVKFVDWPSVPEDGRSSHFYHPFDPPPVRDGFNAMSHWLALRDAGVDVPPLDGAVSIQAALCDANLSPKTFNNRPYDAPVPYAYHLDAVKLGRLLRDIALERGVTRIVDHVVGVDRREDGDIAALRTRDGRTIAGDFFIDCSGFNALLIEQTLGARFLDHSDRLLCDRAIACQTPYDQAASPPRCYTTVTAKTAGWTWDIDLSTRRGTGYVYSSRFIDDAAAEAELKAHVGLPDSDFAPRLIQARVGRQDRPWINNCLAIGLAAGFIEPLESTGIHFIELGLGLFVDYLAEGAAAEPLRARYNAVFANLYDEVVNFIMLHYIFNQRRGLPFWDHYREKVVLPPSLVEQLQLWAYKMPGRTDLRSKISIFDGFNYFAIMAGMKTLPPVGANISPFIDLERSAAFLDEIAATQKRAVAASPSHADMLQKIRSVAG